MCGKLQDIEDKRGVEERWAGRRLLAQTIAEVAKGAFHPRSGFTRFCAHFRYKKGTRVLRRSTTYCIGRFRIPGPAVVCPLRPLEQNVNGRAPSWQGPARRCRVSLRQIAPVWKIHPISLLEMHMVLPFWQETRGML